MAQTARIEENVDFQQMALPLGLGIGERILLHIRLKADSALGAWYELYLIMIPSGFLIEKHSGLSRGLSRQNETWFRRTFTEADRKS